VGSVFIGFGSSDDSLTMPVNITDGGARRADAASGVAAGGRPGLPRRPAQGGASRAGLGKGLL